MASWIQWEGPIPVVKWSPTWKERITLGQWYGLMGTIALLWIFNALIWIGWKKGVTWESRVQSFVQLYGGLFLMYRFNLFRHPAFTPLDARVAFLAGVLLVSTSVLRPLAEPWIDHLSHASVALA
jgi:hypothetical protein